MQTTQKKRALITGGGSGINLALVKALHEKGHSVLIADRGLHPEASTWLESLKEGGPSETVVEFHELDVCNWSELEQAFDVFSDRLGGAPEIVVAGAGVYEASCAGFWNDEDDDSHYKLFDINLLHPIKLTRIAIRRLRRANSSGVVLHLSSIVAQKTNVVLPLYAVSKAGLSHFVRCMAQLDSLAQIRVVAVAPGVVDTPLFRDHPEALKHIDIDSDFALPREEVVKAMLALIFDTNYASGTVLEVGDIDGWREVHALNDCGPQGRSTLRRTKAVDAVSYVEKALQRDSSHKK